MPRGQRARWVPVFAVLVLGVVSLIALVWAQAALG
jgi:hypothetical protein